VISNKLQQLGELSEKLFAGQRQSSTPSGREKAYQSHPRHSLILEEEKKRSVMNMTRPSQTRRSIIYFGHESWNLMLNMMLGVRRSLKSHYYKFGSVVAFSEEDLNCKYYHELLYKCNDKSLKEISEVFVDYSPKVFYFLRKHFSIDNSQFLKSIGLESLIGNLILGNLSTLSDQTSEGKSGSFMYYTEDSKIIVKSISRDEYRKLREILNDYVEYVRRNAGTFLMRIYGLYKMKNKSSGREIYFMVIGNVFDKEVEINERYDLKGATHNRQTLAQGETLLDHALFNRNIALKDVDLIKSGRKFDIDQQQRQQFLP
jgi:1-phosphatidylinositol-4-phosphate 5-kinase